MANIYNPLRNYYKLALQFINPLLRKPILVQLYHLVSYPCQQVFGYFSTYRDSVYQRVHVTGEVAILEYAMNWQLRHLGTLCWVYLAEDPTAQVDFIVCVERRLHGQEAIVQQIRSFFDAHKLAGKSYRLEWFYTEATGPWSHHYCLNFWFVH